MGKGVIAHLVPSTALFEGRREGPDFDVRGHGDRTRELSLRIAAAMGVLDEVRDALLLGAALHDIGKLLLPTSILTKTGPLNEAEWEVVRTHCALGEELLRPIDFLAPAVPVIRSHHERWDGTGYPDRLAGEEIPLAARIVAVADTFDAMVSDRPYRKAMPLEAARDEILLVAGTQLDPVCAETFVKLIRFSEPTLGEMLRRPLPSGLARRAS